METSDIRSSGNNEEHSFAFKTPLTRKLETSHKPEEETKNNKEISDNEESKEKNASTIIKNIAPPYQEPKWSGIPEEPYSFEVLKNGIIINKIDLNEKPFLIFGRMDSCDIILEHPSISRFHAVIQYKKSDDETKGFYVFDMGSTHGTFVNKVKISQNVYTKLKVGYVIKFGGSSRLFILQGPEHDEEPESELTVTEIKELAKKNLQEQAEVIEKDNESEGINWGIAEDAEEISSENPFALSNSDELNIEDPKKTLRGWFEREGCDLVYNVEEIGIGHFTCKIELPICDSNGEPIIAEADVKGKKKEVVVACALEACRILDQQGVLRQSHHESRKRKKNWEETDFYASDEDTYLDRTGTIEKKREKRKHVANKVEAETYETIVKKLSEIDSKILEIESKLAQEKQNSISHSSNNALDSLDDFMNSLKSVSILDKATKSKFKQELGELKKQKERYEKLATIAKPTSLPPIEPSQTKSNNKDLRSFIGKRKIPKRPFPRTFHQPVIQKPQQNMEFEEEVEEENDGDDSKMNEKSKTEIKINESEILENSKSISFDDKFPKDSSNTQNPSEIIPVSESKKAFSTKSLDNKVLEKSMLDAHTSSPKKVHSEKQRIITCNPESSQKKIKDKKVINKPSGIGEYNENDPDYSMWLPPDNQEGDGITHLNAKYGY